MLHSIRKQRLFQRWKHYILLCILKTPSLAASHDLRGCYGNASRTIESMNSATMTRHQDVLSRCDGLRINRSSIFQASFCTSSQSAPLRVAIKGGKVVKLLESFHLVFNPISQILIPLILESLSPRSS